MKAGKMRHRIIIEQLTVTKSATGFETPTWSTLATVWADFQGISGREVLAMEREIASEMAKFFIRYRANISTLNRIRFRSQKWDIKYVRVVGNNEGLEILAEVNEREQ